METLSFPITFGNPRAGRAVQPSPAPAPEPQSIEADPGYVYLSASRAMPGFVQVCTSQDDPEGLSWSLQTVSGVTRFRNVHSVHTTNCQVVAERFRQAVLFDQIPHHSDLFKIPLRFARNILDVEATPFLIPDAAPRAERGWSMALIASIALAVALPCALFVRPTSQATARESHKANQPASAPELAKPQFRISKM